MPDHGTEWEDIAGKYRIFIQLEKGLSANTIESYMRDISQFRDFISDNFGVGPMTVTADMVEQFMGHLFDRGVEKTTQGRILSGVRSFYKYLLLEDLIGNSPAEFVDHPKSALNLPDTLTLQEIDSILNSIDLSTALGRRNRAIIETLYSCGLRVSELISLKLSDLFFDENFVRVTGKGNKQRLVPVSPEWKKQVNLYLDDRAGITPDNKSGDILFLNRRRGKLSRVMVFNVIKAAAQAAEVRKSISPHTFRHSFATHLLQGGASIRQVQELLGHESITTTEIYTHLNSDHLGKTLSEHHPLGNSEKLRIDGEK